MSRLQEREAKDPTILKRETQQSNDPTVSSISQQQGGRTSFKREETFNRTISIWMFLFLLLRQMEQLQSYIVEKVTKFRSIRWIQATTLCDHSYRPLVAIKTNLSVELLHRDPFFGSEATSCFFLCCKLAALQWCVEETAVWRPPHSACPSSFWLGGSEGAHLLPLG